MDRNNHYEAAFEAYLQARGLGYIAIDETRRASLGSTSIKSLDFVVYGQAGARLLIDIKGHRFPTGSPEKQRRVWESWVNAEDVSSMEQWMALFGPGFQAVFVFAYHVLPCVDLSEDIEDLWCFRGRRYLFRAVSCDDYRAHMRRRSPSWGTVALPTAAFRRLVQPFRAFTDCPGAVEEIPF